MRQKSRSQQLLNHIQGASHGVHIWDLVPTQQPCFSEGSLPLSPQHLLELADVAYHGYTGLWILCQKQTGICTVHNGAQSRTQQKVQLEDPERTLSRT